MASPSIRTKAGLAKRGVPAPSITAGDLIIKIRPPDEVRWFGTRAALLAEKIVPDDASWDMELDSSCQWNDGDYDLELRRWTPAGFGRISREERAKIDWWLFERRDRRYHGMGCWPQAIHENREEYARLVHGLEVCIGKRPSSFHAWYEASRDARFQALLARALSAEPCPVITQQSLAQTKAKRARAVARLRAESRRAKGDEAGEAA